MKFFLRLWCGDVRLVITYWVFGVLLGWLIGISVGILFVALNVPLYVTSLVMLPPIIFVLVAIWRSANKYTGPRGWKKAAQMSVVLTIIFYGIDLFLSLVTRPLPS